MNNPIPTEADLDRPDRPIPPYLTSENFRLFLADHYQLVDQVASLTVALIDTWESEQQLRSLLDLPRRPLPLAASRASAARIAAQLTSASPAPAAPALGPNKTSYHHSLTEEES